MLVLRYIYLPGSNSSHVEYSCFCFYKEKGGVTSPIRQVFYKHVVVLYCFSFLSCCLFFGSHHNFLGRVTEPRCNPKCITSCPMLSADKPAAHTAALLQQSADSLLSILHLYLCTFSTSVGSCRILLRPSKRRAALW